MSAAPPPSLRAWLPGLVALGVIWGASFLFIKLGVQSIHPLWVAAGRLIFGALALAVLLLVRGERLPRDPRAWWINGVAGVIGCAIPFSLFGFAGERIPASLSGLWNSTVPLVVLPLAVLVFRTEKLTVRRLLGLLIGTVGVLVILGVWDLAGQHYDLVGQFLCLAAACCYGVVISGTRRFISGRPESALVSAACQMITGTIAMVPVALIWGGAPFHLDRLPSMVSVVAVIALGALGTGVGYLINIRNIAMLGASGASGVTYLVPVFAAVLGWLVLGETLGWHHVVGGLIVLAGVAVAYQQRARGATP